MWKLRALKSGGYLATVLPASIGYSVCWSIAFVVFLVYRQGRRGALENLRRTEPRSTRLRRYRSALRVFHTVITNYYDLVRLPSTDPADPERTLEVIGREYLSEAINDGKGVIVVAVHLGNFSVVPQFASTLGCEAALVAERVEPAALFEYLARLRSTLGISIIPAGREAVRPILRLLHRGGLVIMAGDRDVLHQGMRVPFFGAPAPLPAGPVVLAMRTGARLIPASTIRVSTRRSIARIEPAIDLQDSGDFEEDLRENMRRTARRLERMIAAAPEQWAVLQHVWAQVAEPEPHNAAGQGYSADESSTRYS